jgi:WD40 repeat protein
MRARFALLILILAFMIIVLPAYAATYQFAATYKNSIYLIAKDGKTMTKLIKGFDYSIDHELLMVSPDGKMLAVYASKGEKRWLCRVDIATGETTLVKQIDDTYFTQDCQAWFGNSVLFEEFNKDGIDLGVHAVDILTGKTTRVTPLEDDEFFHDRLLESPSGGLLATTQGVTNVFWITVNDGCNGKRLWMTNPDNGMEGFTDVCWSPDSRSLLTTFYKDDEEFPGPGGLWKFDAMTGKQQLIKYKGQKLWGLKFSPDGKLLAITRDNQTDVLSYPNLKLVRRLNYKGSLYFLGKNHYLIFDGKRIVDINGSTITTRTYVTKAFYKEGSELAISISPEADALLLCCTSINGSAEPASGFLDLKTGRTVSLPKDVYRVVWLPHPISR